MTQFPLPSESTPQGLAGGFLAACLLLLCLASSARAQSDLLRVNDSTFVHGVSFLFPETNRYPPVIDAEALQNHITTQAPGLFVRMRRRLGGRVPQQYLLRPVELQKDVVRLRQRYQQEGFPRPLIDYGASTFHATTNTIRIRFTVEPGNPIIIQDVGFYANWNYLANLFEGDLRADWIRFRDRTSFKTGDRYTAFGVIGIQDQVLTWLRDRGYAFATLETQAEIDSTYLAADISFLVTTGPAATIGEILIKGNHRVSDRIVRRELPFTEGDAYSHRKLLAGQRELFGLNLFQVARVDLPQQPRDSAVTVRVSLRESKPRYVAAEVGYEQQDGLTATAQWSHRNFLGGARTLSWRAETSSGLLASSGLGVEPKRLLRTSLALGQPYILTNGLRAVLESFLQYERDPLLRDKLLALGLNRREYGVTGLLIYELLTYRTLSLRYGLSRATQFAGARELQRSPRDAYNKETVTLSATLGWANNILNPRRGFLIRPFVEWGGGLSHAVGLRDPALEYIKTGLELTGYIPITQKIQVGLRLSAGRVWPFGRSRQPVDLYAAGSAAITQFDPLFAAPLEDRFDPVRFYAGGSNDVRGWSFGLVGPKVNRTAFARDANGDILYDAGEPTTTTNQYEPIGGLARLVGNVEIRLPVPGLGNAWRAAVFLDAGQVSSRTDAPEACASAYYRDREHTERINVHCGFRDTGGLFWDRFKVGSGAGIRYETPIGHLRLDVAFKLNPDDLDLQTPRNAFLARQGVAAPRRSFLQRMNVHVTLGQAF